MQNEQNRQNIQNEREEQIQKMLRKIEDIVPRREASLIYREVIAGLFAYQEQQLEKLKQQVFHEYTNSAGYRQTRNRIGNRTENWIKNQTGCRHIEMCLCSSGETKYYSEGFTLLLAAGSNQAVWGSGSIERVYVKAGKRQISKILHKNNIFRAVVRTNYETYPVSVTLRPVNEALEKAEQINRLMYVNGWDMPPVNTIYLQGFYDVCFCHVLDRLRSDEYMETADIDFGELTPYVQRDLSLMWNLRRIECKEQSFPQALAQIDEIYYNHTIPLPDSGHIYLADLPETERCSVSRTETALMIKNTEKQYGSWTLYELLGGRTVCGNKDVPVMSNDIADGIIGALQKKRQLLTAGEVYRCVHAYEVSEAFDRIEIPCEGQLLFYPKDDSYYLNRDIMDYILSDMERLFAGCHFKGRLVTDEK